MNASAKSSSFLFSSHGPWRKPFPPLSRHGLVGLRVPACAIGRNPKRNEKSDEKVEMVIDLDDIASRASRSVNIFVKSANRRLNTFVSSGAEVLTDLQSLVTINPNGRIVIACRRTSLHFMGNFLIGSFVFFYVMRFLVKVGLRSGIGFGGIDLVRRRDRSLGGREVIVGKKFIRKRVSVPIDYSSASGGTMPTVPGAETHKLTLKKETLPDWWPHSVRSHVVTTGSPELRREANRLIRAIMDNRMSGKDFTEDDIVQLRHICKSSGTNVSFDTTNSRDSFYRASVEFILDICRRSRPDTMQVDGEGPREFLSGLADNIGLENTRAATIISAVVAASTRSAFLQAWAYEVQGKRPEALNLLSNMCNIHLMFPPEENSPEMEMVAYGLAKHLKVEQKEHLFKLLGKVCDGPTPRSLEEALGLMLPLLHEDGLERSVNGHQ
ncbi:hypothetical protein H6P81_013242 [Aristolochia fimbriata]|uniref:Uncharacterized protein n=1 Tax=Aristolochia fimbriata TaxID=158543 RepID=A0AAV7EFS3_ARIFI|nr:hypothetical protein H6P81_013242 [Aristolochia fimbriata]